VPALDGNNGVTSSLLSSTVTDYRAHCQALLPAWDIIPDHRLNYVTKHKPGSHVGFEHAIYGSARSQAAPSGISPLGHIGRLVIFGH